MKYSLLLFPGSFGLLIPREHHARRGVTILMKIIISDKEEKVLNNGKK